MIRLTEKQFVEYVIPLVQLTMGHEQAEDLSKICKKVQSSDSETDFYAFFDMDKIVAVGGLGSEISPRKRWLGYWAVHPDYRNKGIGNKVLDFIENMAREKGYQYIFVETYEAPQFEAAIKQYHKRGYKEVGYLSDYTIDDLDAIYLRKTL